MRTLLALRRRAFGVPSAEAVFRSPGFVPQAWDRFSSVARVLVDGYHAALEEPGLDPLVQRLDAAPANLRGIAYEGAGMGLAALDILTRTGFHRVRTLGEGPARNHLYPLYIGVGMALARMRRPPEPALARLDPIIGWVIADGIGFHETFFRRTAAPPHVMMPTHLSPPMQRIFHHGVGRALWFSLGATPALVEMAIESFPEERHADLWAGVGLAATYVGGAGRDQLSDLRTRSGPHASELATSSVIAAWGRHLGGDLGANAEVACAEFSARSARQAAQLGTDTKQSLPVITVTPKLLLWRDHIAHQLTQPVPAPA